MYRTSVILAAMAMLFALALPAFGAGPDWPAPPPPPHAHMLLLQNGGCIDLAANQVVPINAHHANLHVGTANSGQDLAGHSIIPAIAWPDCEAFLAAQP